MKFDFSNKKNIGIIGIIFLAVIVFAILYTTTQEPSEENGCICPTIWEPVCGTDGKTYSNTCYAECEGIEIAYEGECEEEIDEENGEEEIDEEEISESELEEKMDSFLEEVLSELEEQEGEMELPGFE